MPRGFTIGGVRRRACGILIAALAGLFAKVGVSCRIGGCPGLLHQLAVCLSRLLQKRNAGLLIGQNAFGIPLFQGSYRNSLSRTDAAFSAERSAESRVGTAVDHDPAPAAVVTIGHYALNPLLTFLPP